VQNHMEGRHPYEVTEYESRTSNTPVLSELRLVRVLRELKEHADGAPIFPFRKSRVQEDFLTV
jgi:hypothetical protein